jgi:hypothetical protein
MSATGQLADGRDPSMGERAAGADGGPDPAVRPGGDEAARARAYLDLWERHLVHAAVRTRHGPGARGEAGRQ